MEIKIRTVGILIIFLLCVISFDAWQQYYYLTNFDILETGTTVTLWELIYSHTLKWLIWALFIIPMIYFIRYMGLWKNMMSVSGMVKAAGMMVTAILLAVSTISIINTIQDHGMFTLNDWIEVVWFNFFQKFATFLLGYLLVLYYMYHRYQLNHMEGKISTISELRNSYRDLYEDLKEQSIQEETSVLYVKVGNKIKAILIPDIQWIQSDDYCVRVHTMKNEYALRKSMKAMEVILPDYFVRVHRQAIINMKFMKELIINEKVAIILQDGTEVAVAKSRLPHIKKMMVIT